MTSWVCTVYFPPHRLLYQGPRSIGVQGGATIQPRPPVPILSSYAPPHSGPHFFLHLDCQAWWSPWRCRMLQSLTTLIPHAFPFSFTKKISPPLCHCFQTSRWFFCCVFSLSPGNGIGPPAPWHWPMGCGVTPSSRHLTFAVCALPQSWIAVPLNPAIPPKYNSQNTNTPNLKARLVSLNFAPNIMSPTQAL